MLAQPVHLQAAAHDSAALTAPELSDIRTFVAWATTATVQSVTALEIDYNPGSYTMRPSVPTGHVLSVCTIDDHRMGMPGPILDIAAGCMGHDAVIRNAQTQTACRRQGVAAIAPLLTGYAYARHTAGALTPSGDDTWTLGNRRMHFECLTAGAFGDPAVTPAFRVSVEITVGSQPFYPV